MSKTLKQTLTAIGLSAAMLFGVVAEANAAPSCSWKFHFSCHSELDSILGITFNRLTCDLSIDCV